MGKPAAQKKDDGQHEHSATRQLSIHCRRSTGLPFPWRSDLLRQARCIVKDQGTDIDAGSGAGESDLYVTVQGREFRVTVALG